MPTLQEAVQRLPKGRVRVLAKEHMAGVRDLQAALFQLALSASQDRGRKACLVTRMDRISKERLQQEWKNVQRVFSPAIASRLALVVLIEDAAWASSEDPDLARILAHVKRAGSQAPKPAHRFKFFEVFKVLLGQWLLKRGPMTMQELMRRTGCSYPTAAEAVDRLPVTRRSDRSVELAAFPHQSWREMLALLRVIREPMGFKDVSGRPPDFNGLLRRLTKAAPPSVALGGVHAARFWHRGFDLHGTPRIDLVVHAPVDASFVTRADPALQPAADDPTIVIHPLYRAQPLFEPDPKGRLPIADPVETLLDLYELKLTDQADALIRHLKGRA